MTIRDPELVLPPEAPGRPEEDITSLIYEEVSAESNSTTFPSDLISESL